MKTRNVVFSKMCKHVYINIKIEIYFEMFYNVFCKIDIVSRLLIFFHDNRILVLLLMCFIFKDYDAINSRFELIIFI